MWPLIIKIFVNNACNAKKKKQTQNTDNSYIVDYLCYCYLQSLSTITEENVVLMEKS